MAVLPRSPTSIVITETIVVPDNHRPKRSKRRREATEELSVLGIVYTARAVLVSSFQIPLSFKKKVGPRPPICRACSPQTL